MQRPDSQARHGAAALPQRAGDPEAAGGEQRKDQAGQRTGHALQDHVQRHDQRECRRRWCCGVILSPVDVQFLPNAGKIVVDKAQNVRSHPAAPRV